MSKDKHHESAAHEAAAKHGTGAAAGAHHDPDEPHDHPALPAHPRHDHVKTVKVDTAHELEAIRGRLAQRRHELYGAGVPVGHAGAYTTTDLADAEWLLVELDKALGHADCLTPCERHDLDVLTAKRKLPPHQQAVMDRISAKHGELTAEELVEKDYLTMKQDALLSAAELEHYHGLCEKSKKTQPKAA